MTDQLNTQAAREYAAQVNPPGVGREAATLAHLAGQQLALDSRPWWQRAVGMRLKLGAVIIRAIPSPYPHEADNTAWAVILRAELPEGHRDRYVAAAIMPQLLQAKEWIWGCYHNDEETAALCIYQRACSLESHEPPNPTSSEDQQL